jgi:uncharacterized protein DUF397
VWRKSSFSEGGATNCVEVALTDTGTAVRDSKNPAGLTLRFPTHAWTQLLRRRQVTGYTDSR